MTSNITPLNPQSALDPDNILENAKGKFNTVLVLGFDKQDKELFVSSTTDAAEILWLIERMKLRLLNLADQL